MNSLKTTLIMWILGTVWVGGCGWLMYRYPSLFAKWNSRFGVKTNQKVLRLVGFLEMTLAAIGAIGIPVALLLGWY